MENMHHGYETSSSATGEMDQEDTCATISTLIFWRTDATYRSCRAGSSVKEKGRPTEAENVVEEIHQPGAAAELPQEDYSQLGIPTTHAGNKAAQPPALVPRHLALFHSAARDFH